MSGYIRFTSTGVKHIDAILNMIERAGDGYHHTEQWNDDDHGPSYVSQIEDAAKEAAEEIERLRKDLSLAVFADNEYWQVLEKENERLRSALERIAFGKYHWEADAQEEARAALETREAGVSSEVKND